MKKFVGPSDEKITRNIERDNALNALKDLLKEINADVEWESNIESYNYRANSLLQNAMNLGVSDVSILRDFTKPLLAKSESFMPCHDAFIELQGKRLNKHSV